MHNIAAKTCLFVSSLALLQERNCFLYGLVKPRFTRGDPVTLPGLRVIFDPSYAHPSKAVLTRGYTPVGTSLLAQEPPGGQLGHETMRVVDQISSDPVPVDDVLVRHEQSEQDSGIARQGQPGSRPPWSTQDANHGVERWTSPSPRPPTPTAHASTPATSTTSPASKSTWTSSLSDPRAVANMDGVANYFRRTRGRSGRMLVGQGDRQGTK